MIMIFYQITDNDDHDKEPKPKGRRLMFLGLTLFICFPSIYENLFSSFNNNVKHQLIFALQGRAIYIINIISPFEYLFSINLNMLFCMLKLLIPMIAHSFQSILETFFF